VLSDTERIRKGGHERHGEHTFTEIHLKSAYQYTDTHKSSINDYVSKNLGGVAMSFVAKVVDLQSDDYSEYLLSSADTCLVTIEGA